MRNGTDASFWSLDSCDHLPHLQENLALSAERIIGSHLDIISKQCDTDINLLQKGFDRIASIKTLSDLLDTFNINYIAPQKFHEINFPGSHFDLFFSSSVLQRVPISDLSAYMQNLMCHKEFINLFNQFGFVQISDETVSLNLSLSNKVVLSSKFRSIPLEDVLITRTQLISKRI